MLQFLQGLLKEVAPNSKTHPGASVSHLQTTNAGYSPGLLRNSTEAPHDPQGAGRVSCVPESKAGRSGLELS